MATIKSSIRRIGCATATAMLALYPEISRADEGGISFWVPGLEGSLAATPTTPGWSVATIYYHTSVNGGGAGAASREFPVGRFFPNVTINLNIPLQRQADHPFLSPTYTLPWPDFGRPVSAT